MQNYRLHNPIFRRRVPPKIQVPLPMIWVEDWHEQPPLATRYVCGDNDIDVDALYSKVRSLSSHPGCGTLLVTSDGQSDTITLRECSLEFRDLIWECLSKIADYFADFAGMDRPAMQCMWFHMIDVIQLAVKRLPHDFWEEEEGGLCCKHSKDFSFEYQGMLRLINNCIRPRFFQVTGDFVRPDKELMVPSAVDLRGFKAGLKPWQQFLYDKGPGFEVDARYLIADQRARKIDVPNWPEQFVPMGGVAIIDRQTQRIKSLVQRVSEKDETESTRLLEETLGNEVKYNSLDLEEPFWTYMSLDGRHKSAEAMHPLIREGPQKYSGLGDRSCLSETPGLNLLDEAIGNYKGMDEWVHPSGDNGHDDFHMLSIRTTPRSVLRGIYPPQEMPVVDVKTYLDMFDEWTDVGIS